MKNVLTATDDIFDIITGLSLVEPVYKYKKSNTIFPDAENYYVVLPLVIDADQLQEGVEIVNIHAANISATVGGVPDVDIPNSLKLKSMLDAVLPALDDAMVNDMATKVQNITQFSEKGQTVVSIRISLYAINL